MVPFSNSAADTQRKRRNVRSVKDPPKCERQRELVRDEKRSESERAHEHPAPGTVRNSPGSSPQSSRARKAMRVDLETAPSDVAGGIERNRKPMREWLRGRGSTWKEWRTGSEQDEGVV
ncbi:hypothetical protein NLI96_g7458 [Meripilus lineatus]|uniref:Uncharacterized protein n=1 Tax=Meripilus lineatus TaxID=2056292 RepID=A0AAD5V3W4_9APHY|nr:hypothetical protein NLI96_g7458 [Physisporinus lineatus]